MLLDVPVELLLAILRHLPQSNILAVVLTSKDLYAAGSQFISAFVTEQWGGPAVNPRCESFCSYMLADSRRPLQLAHMKIDETFNLKREVCRQMMDVLRLTRNLTTLELRGTRNALSWSSDSVDVMRSLPRLVSLCVVMFNPKITDEQSRFLSNLPTQLEELKLHAGYIPSFLTYLPLFADLVNLHTFCANPMNLSNQIEPDVSQPTGQLPSIRNLHVNNTRIGNLPALLTPFPRLENLELNLDDEYEIMIGNPPYPPVVRLTSLQCTNPRWTYNWSSSEQARVWKGIQVGWIRLAPYDKDSERDLIPEWLLQMNILERWLKDGYPFGLIFWTPTLDGEFWTELAAKARGLRWMELHWAPEPRSKATYNTAGLLELANGRCPLNIMYLNLGICSALSYSEREFAVHETGALLEQLEGEDERLRAQIVDALPRYIPSLRYLTITRSFDAVSHKGDGPTVRRTWRCYKVTDSRDVVEIPTWEGDRVEAYCKAGADDVEAFDKFAERFKPAR